MARKAKVTKKAVVTKAPRVAKATSGGRRTGAGRKSVEVHFSALNAKLDAIARHIGIAAAIAAAPTAPVNVAPTKPSRRIKVPAPVPATETAMPVAHAASPVAQPEQVARPMLAVQPVQYSPPPGYVQATAPAPQYVPEPVDPADFDARFASLPPNPNP